MKNTILTIIFLLGAGSIFCQATRDTIFVSGEFPIVGDNQVIDTFRINNDVLEISLEDDQQPFKNVNLGIYRQVFDVINITNDTLWLSLSEDNESTYFLDLKPYLDNTDDQVIDTFSYDSGIITISLESDAEAAKTVNISAINTDDQKLTLQAGTGTTSEIHLEDGDSIIIQAGTLITVSESVDTLTISVDNTGDWTGTFDGQEGTYYLDRTNHTGTQAVSTIDAFQDSVSANTDVTANTAKVTDDDITGVSITGGNIQIDEGATQVTAPVSDLISGDAWNDLTISSSLLYIDETDDQTIDKFIIENDTLKASLESDGQADKTVDLDPYRIDDVSVNASNGRVEVTEGGVVYWFPISDLLSDTSSQVINTDSGGKIYAVSTGIEDDQVLDTFDLTGTVLSASLNNDQVPASTVDFAGWDTDGSNDVLTTTGFGGDVSGTYNNLQVTNNSHTHAYNTLPNIVAGLYAQTALGASKGTVYNDGGLIALREGANITLTPSDGNNYIKIDAVTGADSDNQTLSFTSPDLSITGGNSVDLSTLNPNTDNQNLSLGTRVANVQPVNISGGSGVNIDVDDGDSDGTNELQVIDRAVLNGSNQLELSLSNDASTVLADLSTLDNGNQQLGLIGPVGSTYTITLDNSPPVGIDVRDGDFDDTNEEWVLDADDATTPATIRNGQTVLFRGQGVISTSMQIGGGILNINSTAEQNVNADWNASSGDAVILNKPNLTQYQNVQADWNQASSGADDYIKNKPTIPAAQIQSDWNQASAGALDYIKNKPTLNISNWNTAYSWGDHATAGYDPSSTNELQDIDVFDINSGNLRISLTQDDDFYTVPINGFGIYGGSGTVPSGTTATTTDVILWLHSGTGRYITFAPGTGDHKMLDLTSGDGKLAFYSDETWGGMFVRPGDDMNIGTGGNDQLVILGASEGHWQSGGGDAGITIGNTGLFYPEQKTSEPTCNTTTEGAIYYNDTTNKFRGCDGTAWADLN